MNEAFGRTLQHHWIDGFDLELQTNDKITTAVQYSPETTVAPMSFMVEDDQRKNISGIATRIVCFWWQCNNDKSLVPTKGLCTNSFDYQYHFMHYYRKVYFR